MRKEEYGIISNFIWSIKEICKYKKRYIVCMVFEAIVKGLSPVVVLLITQELIDRIQIKSSSFNLLIILLMALVIFELVSDLIMNIINLKLKKYDLEFEAFAQVQILNKISRLKSKDFENSKTYDLINRTQYDANAGILGNVKTLFALVTLIISTGSYGLIVISYNPLFFIAILLVQGLRFIFEKKYSIQEYDKIKSNTEVSRKTSYISYLLTNSEHFKEIKTFQLFDFFINRYKNLKKFWNDDMIALYKRKSIVYCVLDVVETVLDFFIVLVVLKDTFLRKILIGKFILYSNSVDSLKGNMSSIFVQLSVIYKNNAILQQIRGFFDMEEEGINEKGVHLNNIETVELKNVSYRYKPDGEYVLKNLNLFLSKNNFTVIMGKNGSGKSTLIKIIMGVYHDYEGTILINGVDLKKINLKSYRDKVSVIFQDYIKYESTINENIWYGNLKYKDDNKCINGILSKINLDSGVAGAEQMLGYQFSDGRQLSIGQWQRLAIGRALIREAGLYIFDEPNSALDLIAEKKIWDTIYVQTKSEIALCIMHRFNNIVTKANKILVMDKGQIVELGRHKELLSTKGLYYKLYTAYIGEAKKD